MNSRPDDPQGLEPVNLAQAEDLRLGRTVVTPATLQLERDGRAATLEPKVMQVLVLLARRLGQVTTRDDLVAGCWGGRFIGEDAIHRTIAKLRQAATQHAGGDFAIETIPRVGYRLVAAAATARAGEAVPPADSAPVASRRPALAVLAFDNLSGDPDMDYFSDGMSEEILQTVSRNTALSVIARASSFQFRGAAKAAAQVAARLGVSHLLDGSVRRSGQRVRIFAELVDCATETQVWSERYDRELGDVFALQDEIAAAVAAALSVAFTPSQAVTPIDPAAFDLYLRARSAGVGWEASPERIALLESAVARAPDFAAAWAALSNARVSQLRHGARSAGFAVLKAQVVEAADRALALSPASGVAYASLSRLKPWAFYGQREALLQQALAVAPDDPVALTLMGGFENHVGRVDAALACLRRAYELDPLLPLAADVYGAVLGSADHPEAYTFYDTWRARWPEQAVFLAGPLNRTAFRQDWARFDALAAAATPAEREEPTVARALAFGEGLRRGDPTLARRTAERLDRTLAETGTVQLPLLVTACAFGLTDEIFAAVERASFDFMFQEDGGDPAAVYNPGIIFDRSFFGAAIRDPRFVGLCAKLGLCDYWVESGRWPDCAAWVADLYDFKAEARRLAHGGRSQRPT